MKVRTCPVAAVIALSLLSAAAIVAVPARAEGVATPAGCVQLEVRNVRAEQGMLMIAAYGDAGSFNKAPLVATQMRAGAATMSFALCGLSGSSVALTLYQDLNGNGKLDANALGVPSEPWGASGKTAAMTAPSWDSSVVPLDGATIVIKLSQ
jgi:uncharacterized protein (DUF2141 family)